MFFGGPPPSTRQNGEAERRTADRFPIEREVRYKVLNKRNQHEEGTGRTINRCVKTALCRCGGSANKPYCDGTHKTNGFRS